MKVLLAAALLTSPALAAPSIVWKGDSRVLVQRDGHYGRMARIDTKTVICAFDWKGAIQVRRSVDAGKTWEEPVQVSDWDQGSLTNAELLVLKNGEIFCFFNRRPARGRRGEVPPPPAKIPFSIAFCRSGDGGKSWSAPVTLYEAGPEFENGCWEPSGIELPDGEIHVYFANEGPYRESNEQEISLLRSRDRGKTWSKPERISFRAGHRDGMPVPALSRDGRNLYVAIEDNGLSGTFKPVITATTLSGGAWKSGFVDADSPRRAAALATPLPAQAYAGAPYLRPLPSGGFALSFQLADSGRMDDSRMAVCLGDARCRNFGNPSFPFPQTEGTRQLWNSLFVKDSRILTAISETRIDGVHGIWAIDGEIRASP